MSEGNNIPANLITNEDWIDDEYGYCSTEESVAEDISTSYDSDATEDVYQIPVNTDSSWSLASLYNPLVKTMWTDDATGARALLRTVTRSVLGEETAQNIESDVDWALNNPATAMAKGADLLFPGQGEAIVATAESTTIGLLNHIQKSIYPEMESAPSLAEFYVQSVEQQPLLYTPYPASFLARSNPYFFAECEQESLELPEPEFNQTPMLYESAPDLKTAKSKTANPEPVIIERYDRRLALSNEPEFPGESTFVHDISQHEELPAVVSLKNQSNLSETSKKTGKSIQIDTVRSQEPAAVNSVSSEIALPVAVILSQSSEIDKNAASVNSPKLELTASSSATSVTSESNNTGYLEAQKTPVVQETQNYSDFDAIAVVEKSEVHNLSAAAQPESNILENEVNASGSVENKSININHSDEKVGHAKILMINSSVKDESRVQERQRVLDRHAKSEGKRIFPKGLLDPVYILQNGFGIYGALQSPEMAALNNVRFINAAAILMPKKSRDTAPEIESASDLADFMVSAARRYESVSHKGDDMEGGNEGFHQPDWTWAEAQLADLRTESRKPSQIVRSDESNASSEVPFIPSVDTYLA